MSLFLVKIYLGHESRPYKLGVVEALCDLAAMEIGKDQHPLPDWETWKFNESLRSWIACAEDQDPEKVSTTNTSLTAIPYKIGKFFS